MAQKIKTSTADLLEQMNAAIEEVHGEQNMPYNPLIRLAVIGSTPGLSDVAKAAIDKELAPYLFPKLKSVEHSGDGGGIQINLVQFSDTDKGLLVERQVPSELPDQTAEENDEA